MISALLLTAGLAGAQNKVALKTNLLGDASLSPNLGLEFALSPNWTLDLSATVNLWDSYGKTYTHVIAQPEIITRGFVYVKEAEDLMDELRRVVNESLDSCERQRVREWSAIKSRIKSNLSGYLYKTTRRSPMVLPVIIEV